MVIGVEGDTGACAAGARSAKRKSAAGIHKTLVFTGLKSSAARERSMKNRRIRT
jgi:hypothetical protein